MGRAGLFFFIFTKNFSLLSRPTPGHYYHNHDYNYIYYHYYNYYYIEHHFAHKRAKREAGQGRGKEVFSDGCKKELFIVL